MGWMKKVLADLNDAITHMDKAVEAKEISQEHYIILQLRIADLRATIEGEMRRTRTARTEEQK